MGKPTKNALLRYVRSLKPDDPRAALAMRELTRPQKQQASPGEEALLTQIRLQRLPLPVREFAFHGERKWRFDFAWPDLKLAVEVEGGTRGNGRHNRHHGYQSDLEKYNAAALLGWTVLRYTTEQVGQLKALQDLQSILKAPQENHAKRPE